MQITVHDASRFLIGAAILRAKAIENSGDSSITFENVAIAASALGAEGRKIRQSISILAENADIALTNIAQNRLATERIIEGRASEMKAINSIALATLKTVEYSSSLEAGSMAPAEQLKTAMSDALVSIDNATGPTRNRVHIKKILESEVVTAASNNGVTALALLNKAEQEHLFDSANEILSRYDKVLSPSDYSM